MTFPMPETARDELQKLTISTIPLVNPTHFLHPEKELEYEVIRKQGRAELLRENPALHEWLRNSKLLDSKTIHSEVQYTRGTEGWEVAFEAIRNQKAIAVISLYSPCDTFSCTAEIIRFAQETKVPHYVVYRYGWLEQAESRAKLTTYKIPVIQQIGRHLFLRYRELFSNMRNVSPEDFVHALANQHTEAPLPGEVELADSQNLSDRQMQPKCTQSLDQDAQNTTADRDEDDDDYDDAMYDFFHCELGYDPMDALIVDMDARAIDLHEGDQFLATGVFDI